MDVPFTVLIVNSATKNNVTYYLLQISQDDNEEMSYAVDRRFTDFLSLTDKLRSIYGAHIMDKLPQLPKKTFMRQSSDAFVKKRHYFLQQFLNGIHSIPYLVQSKQYRQFLEISSFFPSSIPIAPFLKFVQNKEQHGIRLSTFNMIMLSHNVFISIAGCHPEIAFCSPEKINSIQQRINVLSPSSKSSSHSAAARSKRKRAKSKIQSSSPLLSNGHSHAQMGALGAAPSSSPMPMAHTPTSSILPSPNEWGGCIQVQTFYTPPPYFSDCIYSAILRFSFDPLSFSRCKLFLSVDVPCDFMICTL